MGIRTTISAKPTTAADGHYNITITVDNKGGGGEAFKADVTATWDGAKLTLDSSPAVSPAADKDKASSGSITWSNRSVNEDGTDFTFSVTKVNKDKIKAKACLAGTTTCSEANADVA